MSIIIDVLAGTFYNANKKKLLRFRYVKETSKKKRSKRLATSSTSSFLGWFSLSHVVLRKMKNAIDKAGNHYYAPLLQPGVVDTRRQVTWLLIYLLCLLNTLKYN